MERTARGMGKVGAREREKGGLGGGGDRTLRLGNQDDTSRTSDRSPYESTRKLFV